MRPAIGNDVVDLTRAEARGKARDERFVRRVFTVAEADWIRSSSDPDLALWMLWAAKEAAFKVVSKQDGGAVFAHRSYEVEPPPLAALTGAAGRARGVVRVQSERGRGDAGPSLPAAATREVAALWDWSALRVHCLAVSDVDTFVSVRTAVGSIDPSGKSLAPVEWTERELSSARTPESYEARLLAKRLALEAGLCAVEVVRNPGARRPGPPLLYAVGAAAPLESWDVTLSHDGDFAAAALCGSGKPDARR